MRKITLYIAIFAMVIFSSSAPVYSATSTGVVITATSPSVFELNGFLMRCVTNEMGETEQYEPLPEGAAVFDFFELQKDPLYGIYRNTTTLCVGLMPNTAGARYSIKQEIICSNKDVRRALLMTPYTSYDLPFLDSADRWTNNEALTGCGSNSSLFERIGMSTSEQTCLAFGNDVDSDSAQGDEIWINHAPEASMNNAMIHVYYGFYDGNPDTIEVEEDRAVARPLVAGQTKAGRFDVYITFTMTES